MTISIDGIEVLPGGLDTTTQEGITSLYTVTGIERNCHVNMDVADIAATVGLMLVDLSDNVNWPHVATGRIYLLYLMIDIEPESTFRGEVALGFLENVDGSNGDFHTVIDYRLDKKADPIITTMNFGSYAMTLDTDHWFGPTILNDTTWQTDVNLLGPNGATSFSAGDGDLVCKVTRTAGEASIGITVGYETYE